MRAAIGIGKFGLAKNPQSSRNSPQELVNQPASQLSGSVVFRQRPQKIFNLICKSRQQHGILVWLRPSMPPGFHGISSDMIMLGIEESLNHSFVCHRFPLSLLYGSPAWPQARPFRALLPRTSFYYLSEPESIAQNRPVHHKKSCAA